MKSLVITKDNYKRVFESLERIREGIGRRVLVGIPDGDKARKDGDPINNATLGYIHEFGSPANNIPARPFLFPGVKDAQDEVTALLRKGIKAAIAGDNVKLDQALSAAGMAAVAKVTARITSNIPPPLKPSTIRSRKYSRGTASRRENEDFYGDLLEDGLEPAAAQYAAGIKSLLNTGQLLRSITYVIRGGR